MAEDELMGTAASRRAVISGGLMALGAAGAYLAVPRAGDKVEEPQLATRVPSAFAGWSADTNVSPVLPDEALQATIKQIYDETLSRTYRDGAGNMVMLVIAYGAQQTESLQAHQPEVCYAAQGFQVTKHGPQPLPAPYAAVPAERVYATMGARTEPILYWLGVAGDVTNFGLTLRWRQIKMGLRGEIPDGFLVRASLIGPDEPTSYATLGRFLAELLAALPADLRRRMAGV